MCTVVKILLRYSEKGSYTNILLLYIHAPNTCTVTLELIVISHA